MNPEMVRLKDGSMVDLISGLAKEFAAKNELVYEYRGSDVDVWFLTRQDGEVERVLQIAVFKTNLGKTLCFTPRLNRSADRAPLLTKPVTISIETPLAMLRDRRQITQVHPQAGVMVMLHLKSSWAMTMAMIPQTEPPPNKEDYQLW